ncbi:unnamed protein product [Alopecurus aequalis]
MSTDSCSDNGDKLTFAALLVVVGVLALFLLHVLGTLRRRSSHKLVHGVVMGTYTLSYLLVSYTFGLMQESKYYVEEFPVWGVSLLMLLGGTDNLMACNLDDVENWKIFHVKHLLKAGFVVYILSVFGDVKEYRIPLWAILVINLLQSYVRIKSMRMASKSYLLSKTVKPIADYMEHEKQLQLASGKRPDPKSMKGYRYVVAGEHRLEKHLERLEEEARERELDDLKFITVEQIYECKGRLLGSEGDLELKDLCLSMALAKMLNRRFAGVKLVEADLEETKDFVFQGLVGEDKSYGRAFRVIEVELGFVYDLYYTRYPYMYHKARYLALCLPFVMVCLCSWLTYVLFERHRKLPARTHLRNTLFLMAVVTFLEAFQLGLHMTSGWFKVAFIRSYVNKPALQRSCWFPDRLIGLFFRLEVLRPWAERLGQYSLLRNCNRIPRRINCLHYVTLSLVDKTKKGRKKEKLVKLSKQVKQAVVDSLIEGNGHLTNGVRSLRSNGVHEKLSWACDGNVTNTILVWHIATAICKNQLDAAMPKKGWGLSKVVSCLSKYCCACTNKLDVSVSEEDHAKITTASEVASSLSQYCAYLIAFAPDLLPDHSFDSTSILDRSIKDVSELLGSLKGAKKLEAKCEQWMEMDDTATDRDLRPVVLGVRLARQLTNKIEDVAQRWKVLSDFWAEMMLYVAPGDNAQARAHLEALARGGEFITHLWALLTHAGVLERDRVGLDAV